MEDIEFDEDETLDELELGNLKYNTTFLKVLCVLTFIGSGAHLIVFLMYFLNMNNISAFSMDVNSKSGLGILFTQILPPLFCITGAVIMLRLNRIGYLFYVAGAAMPIIYLLTLAILYEFDPMTSFLGLILRYTFNIGFIIMYGTQLYVMKPMSSKKSIEIY